MNWAAELSREEIVHHIDLFRDNPAFTSVRDELLRRAVHAKDLEVVEVLLKAGAGPDYVETWGESLLHHLEHEYEVTRSSQSPTVLRLVELLLSYGANPNQVGSGNWRAMDLGIEHGSTEFCRLLLQYGADPRQRRHHASRHEY